MLMILHRVVFSFRNELLSRNGLNDENAFGLLDSDALVIAAVI
jgi:hypothetical protein